MPPFDWWEIKEALGMANDPLGVGHAAPELLEGLWTRREGALSASPVLVAGAALDFTPSDSNSFYGARRDGDTHRVKRFDEVASTSHSYSFSSDIFAIRDKLYDPIALPVGSLSIGYSPDYQDVTGAGGGNTPPSITAASPLLYRPAVQSVNGNYFDPNETYYQTAGSSAFSDLIHVVVCGLTAVGWMPITCFFLSAAQKLSLRRRSSLPIGNSLSGSGAKDDLAYLIYTRDTSVFDTVNRSNYDYRGLITSSSEEPTAYTLQSNSYVVDPETLPNFGKVPLFAMAGKQAVLHQARMFYLAANVDPGYFRLDNYYAMFDGINVTRVKRSFSGGMLIFIGGYVDSVPTPNYNYTAAPVDMLTVYWTDPGVGWSEGQQNYVKLSTNKSTRINQIFSTSYGLLVLTQNEAFVLRGDYSLNVVQEALPVAIGCDYPYNFSATQVDDVVYTIWKGRLWAISGGNAAPVEGLYLPSDSFQNVFSVSYDPRNRCLLVGIGGSAGNYNWYLYDLIKRAWSRAKNGTLPLLWAGGLHDNSGNLVMFTAGLGANQTLQLRATRTARVRYVTDMGDPVNRKVVRHIRFKVRDSNIGAGVTWQIRWSLDGGAYTAWSALSNKGDGNLYYNFRPQTCREFAFELRAVAAGTNNPVISDDKVTELMIEMPIRIAFTRPGGVR